MAAAAAPYGTLPPWDYATWSSRVLGFLIDGLLVGLGMALLYLVGAGVLATTFHLAGGHEAGRGMCCLLVVLFPLAMLFVGLYNSVYLIAERGYSIGQGVVRIMVVDANGARLSTGTAFVRLLVRVAFSCVAIVSLLDLLWPLWDERRQTLHDKAVNCYVINMR
jgi:uncharacterized RDD family membrane protein YckC